MSSFDKAAANYDSSFTHTKIGLSQRKRVWAYLDKVLKNKQKLSILELNCGTGEDAIYLAKKGHQVKATDLSQSMIEVVNNKILNQSNLSISTQVLDLSNPNLEGEDTFDLIFSNFGGLNCISQKEMRDLSEFINQHLNENGDFIAVIMPEQTLLEKFYRMKSGNSTEYKNRDSKIPLYVNVDGVSVATYFFNEEIMKTHFRSMKFIHTKAIGFIPSYLEKSKFLPIFRIIDWWGILLKMKANKADHYLIHFKKSI